MPGKDTATSPEMPSQEEIPVVEEGEIDVKNIPF